MDDSTDHTGINSPLEATVDAPAARSATNDSDTAPSPRIALVEGSDPGMSCETRSVLRSRLRGASLMLALAFVLFLIWYYVSIDFGDPTAVKLLKSHVAVTVVLCILGASMCRNCKMSTMLLRAKETFIFGLPAAYFLQLQYLRMQFYAENETLGYLKSPAAPWLMLIFTYALFIPNTWRRAAAIIGAMAAAPVITLLVLGQLHEPTRKILDATPTFITELSLIMLVSTLVAVAGVHAIGSLRRQAYEARQLGQYHLRKLIGSGAMGEVYLAEHQLMKRPCAIKLIRPEKAGDPKVLARFEREVRATAKLSHWNNIDIFDYGRADDGTFYYVMEFLPGLNLHDLVQRYGPLPAGRLIYLLTQTCDALAEAHGKGLIHRDIKPANIFAAKRGGIFDVAKLLDFGLAKPLAETSSAQLTHDGSITGSPLYMSPEQAAGEREPDGRSDIYALGAVAYFVLTGQPLFKDISPIKVLIAHASRPVVPPSELNADIPADLERVVLRCLEKDPANRFPNVQVLAAALAECEAAGDWSREQAARWWTTNVQSEKEAEAVTA